MIDFEPLPFDEAIAFFRGKVPLSPEQYRQLSSEARAKAFSVGGVGRMDVVRDLYAGIDRAITDGTAFADFKKSVKETMVKRGWDGMAPFRLDTIFRTNIQQAYQAGHYAQQMEVVDTRPFWQYVAVMDGRTRPAHRAMNGKVLPANDPFWKTSYPPNGFNCRCTVRSLSEGEMEREGLTTEAGSSWQARSGATPAALRADRNGTATVGIADAGFDNNPGASMGIRLTEDQFSRLKGDPERWTPLLKKTFTDYGRPGAKDIAPREITTALWPAGEKARARYRDTMMGRTLTDAVDDPLIMNEPFIDHLTLDGRERFIPFIETIVATPDEIWLQAEKEKETGRVVLRKRYIAWASHGKTRRFCLVAEATRGQWESYTFFDASRAAYVDGERKGVLLWKRGDGE